MSALGESKAIAQTNGTATLGGVTGKGFRKGRSGNPGGRPKGFGSYIRTSTAEGTELVDFVLLVLRNGPPEGPSWKVPLRVRLEAATWLADRAFGKPVQQTDGDGDGGVRLTVVIEERPLPDGEAARRASTLAAGWISGTP